MFPKISVIVVTYNPLWNKLYLTLNSILIQRFKDFEIILADDGSRNNLYDRAISFFKKRDFTKYKLVPSDENVGTVSNIANALKQAKGKYVKLISPGDLFFNEDSLKKWIEFMEAHDSRVCFGNSVYYTKNNDEIEIIRKKIAPANIELYEGENSRKALFIDYLLANDSILGAAFMMERSTISSYINMIVGKLRYAEDYMVRIMVFDGVRIDYYNAPLIWYEYGEGISTNQEDIWSKRLFTDFQTCNQIICETCNAKDSVAKRYKRFLKFDIKRSLVRKIVKCLMFPSVIYWRKKAGQTKEYTFIDVDKRLIEQFFETNEN